MTVVSHEPRSRRLPNSFFDFCKPCANPQWLMLRLNLLRYGHSQDDWHTGPHLLRIPLYGQPIPCLFLFSVFHQRTCPSPLISPQFKLENCPWKSPACPHTQGMLLTSGIVSIAQHLFVHGEAGFRTIEGHEGPWHWTLLSIILHASLSVSALIFKPPVTRSVAQPMIYKEFQLHSITFALRSCSVMLCLYAGAKFAPFRGIFILVAHWSADVITSIYKQGTTMRDMPYPSGLSELIQARLNLFCKLT